MKVATLTAQIASLEAQRAKTPGMALLLDPQITKKKAQLQAAQAQLELVQESEQSTRVWRGLGWTGAGVGILVGVGLVALLVAGTRRVSKE